MKKVVFVLSVLLVIFANCSSEDLSLENGSVEESTKVVNEEADRAQALIQQFSDFVNKQKNDVTKSASTLTFKLKEKHSVPIKSIVTRSNGDVLENVNLYIYDIEKDGKFGFAIASGDEITGQVYAYVENGSLKDTIYNKAMAYVLNQIPEVIEQNIREYTPAIRTSASQYSYVGYPLSTKWNQGQPYNWKLPTNGKCTNSYYYTGCTTTAMAQAIVYYRKFPVTYDWTSFAASPYIYTFSNSTLIEGVSSFMKRILSETSPNYGCGGTGVSIENAANALKKWGYNVEYAKTNDVDRSKLMQCLFRNNVVIFCGFPKKGDGHTWLVDAGVFQSSSSRAVLGTFIGVHCNWGWGGDCDGWYSVPACTYNDPVHNAPQTAPPSEQSSPIASYYRENRYIYFNEDVSFIE